MDRIAAGHSRVVVGFFDQSAICAFSSASSGDDPPAPAGAGTPMGASDVDSGTGRDHSGRGRAWVSSAKLLVTKVQCLRDGPDLPPSPLAGATRASSSAVPRLT